MGDKGVDEETSECKRLTSLLPAIDKSNPLPIFPIHSYTDQKKKSFHKSFIKKSSKRVAKQNGEVSCTWKMCIPTHIGIIQGTILFSKREKMTICVGGGVLK